MENINYKNEKGQAVVPCHKCGKKIINRFFCHKCDREAIK